MFQIPLILTSSVMCILNSFEREDESNMKIPNVVVNGFSVIIISLQNNLKVPEKVVLFKNLSNEYLTFPHAIEALEPDTITREMMNNFTKKYDALQTQCLFEDIPHKYKVEVIKSWGSRALPTQLNGASGMKRHSENFIQMSSVV